MSLYKEIKFYKRTPTNRCVILQQNPVTINPDLICWAKRSIRKEEILAKDVASQSSFKEVTVYEIGLSDNSKWIIPTYEYQKLAIDIEESVIL